MRGVRVGDDLAVLELSRREVPHLDGLTQAERDVALLAIEGKTNSDIARLRHTSARTVANQLRSVYHKLGVSSRAELASRLS
jgi:DNA-binding CsgD family transcriptional regulator